MTTFRAKVYHTGLEEGPVVRQIDVVDEPEHMEHDFTLPSDIFENAHLGTLYIRGKLSNGERVYLAINLDDVQFEPGAGVRIERIIEADEG